MPQNRNALTVILVLGCFYCWCGGGVLLPLWWCCYQWSRSGTKHPRQCHHACIPVTYILIEYSCLEKRTLFTCSAHYQGMLDQATSFNQDIGNWNVGAVINMFASLKIIGQQLLFLLTQDIRMSKVPMSTLMAVRAPTFQSPIFWLNTVAWKNVPYAHVLLIIRACSTRQLHSIKTLVIGTWVLWSICLQVSK